MTPLPPVLTGDHELVSWLNMLRRRLLEQTPLPSDTCPIDFLKDGFRPKPRAVGQAGKVEQFRVLQVHKDHLICNSYKVDEEGNETIGDAEIQIAKPFELRATPWHEETVGQYTYTYTPGGINADEQKNPWDEREVAVAGEIPLTSCHPAITGTDITWLEKIWPAYTPERSIIYAVKVVEKPVVIHAATVLDAGPPEVLTEDVLCEYVDLNVDGRTWQMPMRKVAICIENTDGTTSRRYVLVRTSCPFD